MEGEESKEEILVLNHVGYFGRCVFRVVTMRFFFALVVIFFTCSELSSDEVISFDYFDQLEDRVVDIESGREALHNLIEYIQDHSGIELSMEKGAFLAIKQLKDTLHPPEDKIRFVDIIFSLIDLNESSEAVSCNLKNTSLEKENETIPADMILGGIEVITGSLLQFVPYCQWAGRAMVADGIRRGFNGMKELDELNRNTQDSWESTRSSDSSGVLFAFGKNHIEL